MENDPRFFSVPQTWRQVYVLDEVHRWEKVSEVRVKKCQNFRHVWYIFGSTALHGLSTRATMNSLLAAATIESNAPNSLRQRGYFSLIHSSPSLACFTPYVLSQSVRIKSIPLIQGHYKPETERTTFPTSWIELVWPIVVLNVNLHTRKGIQLGLSVQFLEPQAYM